MSLSLARRVLTRSPRLRLAIAALLQHVPALDLRLRAVVARLEARPAPLQIDRAHLPEDAEPVYRALADAIARRSPR